jgi:hypothetical protein
MARKSVDPKRMQEFREAKEALREELLRHPDVHSIGIGYRQRNGKTTAELALILSVRRKLPEKVLDKARILPRQMNYFSRQNNKTITVPVDVQESGDAEPYVCGACNTNLLARVRPVPGGFSISGPPGTGTLGGWVWDNVGDRTVLISNNHVLGGLAGSSVRQPGAADGGVPADAFASVVRTATLDATIAAPTASGDAIASIECLGGAVFETVDPALDMQVEKVGRTTSRTCGTVTQVAIDRNHFGSANDFRVDTDDPAVRFAFYGDSGSLIVERTHPTGANWKRVVGLLWGGIPDEFNAFGHPINDVFADLNLKTVCAGIIEEILDSIVFSAPEFGISVDAEGQRLRKGFAREIEKRFLEHRIGKQIHDHLHRNRADIVQFLMTGDGRRAAVAAIRPILARKVTTDELLDHALTQEDVENFARLIRTAQKLRPRMKVAFQLAETLVKRAKGRTIASLLSDKRR